MQTPLVSIIIPTYNRAHLIGETLDSVLAQTYTNWECIVVDDGSIDDTDEVLADYCKKDSRFQYYHRPNDRLKGGNAARNYGFELSKGEYVNWFDSDDLMFEKNIEQKIKYFKKNVKLVIGNGIIVNNEKEIIKDLKFIKNTRKSLFKQYVLKEIEIYTPSVLFKRDFLQGKKIFKNSIQRSQEAEFFGRIFFTLKTFEFVVIDNYGFKYRKNNDSKTYNDQEYNSNFKFSHYFVHNENWKRAILINDKELADFCCDKILRLIIFAYENDDKKNLLLFKNSLKDKISQINYLKINIELKLLPIMKKKNYRIKKNILSIKAEM